MPRNREQEGDGSDQAFQPSRRSYLKATGAAAFSLPLLTGEGAAATERHGISFDTVVDMVDDAGCDPNGDEACGDAIKSEAGENTLLKFPAGTYKLTEKTAVSDYSNFGIVGEGDVTFTVPDDFQEKLLVLNHGSGVLLENITVDQSNATPCIQVAPDDNLQVHGLEMTGEGISSATSGHGPEGSETPNAFNPMVRSSDGEGTVQDIVLHNEGRMGAYSRVGVWIGEGHKGTLTLRDCNVEGFSGNGVYGSRTPGAVQVEGGVYRNNDLSQVRIGSNGSYVDGVTTETDISESRSDNPDEMLNGSGIRIESNRGGSGAAVRNCDVRVGSEVNADTGIKVFSNYSGNFTIENTRVEFNADGYGIRASPPEESSGDVSGTLTNVSVTGDASKKAAVLIENRPETTIEGSCIQAENDRKGIYLNNCEGSQVTDTTINTGGKTLQTSDSDVETSNISEDGSCPAPDISSDSSSDESSDSEDSSDG